MSNRPEFSERTFEFAFNAEFAKKNSAILITCPTLPSSREEKDAGYDVEFELKLRGGRKSSIFLQHKVSRSVDKKSGSNARFFRYANGPYFAFPIDVSQYNRIYWLAAHKHRQIHYCAPLFTSRRVVGDYFMQEKVCERSVWIDIRNGGQIDDRRTHNIVISQDGLNAFLFSDTPRNLLVLNPLSHQYDDILHDGTFTRQEAYELYTDVYNAVVEERRAEPIVATSARRTRPLELPGRLSEESSRTDIICATADILRTWYGVTWFIMGVYDPGLIERR